MNNELINWLLEDKNPAVKYRTQTELLGQPADVSDAKAWIFNKLPDNWFETKGLWYIYYITALAECGLTCDDISEEHIYRAIENLETSLEYGCADFMLLTALMKLGFSEHKSVRNIIDSLGEAALPDGGFVCMRRVKKLNYTPKSCYKADLHALMLLAECHKKSIGTSFGQTLIDYFLKRDIFYKSTDKSTLILDGREGWRTVDTFYPFETMRVGLQNVVEAFSALGYGNDERLSAAWDMLNAFRDENGKVILKGTLTKSYLPKETVGKPSKWVTFYTLLAEKERG